MENRAGGGMQWGHDVGWCEEGDAEAVRTQR